MSKCKEKLFPARKHVTHGQYHDWDLGKQTAESEGSEAVRILNDA